jgi:L-lysine 6-transaminase
MLDIIQPNETLDLIRRYTIGDGYPLVIDTKKSFMSWIIDHEGKSYLDCVSQYASQPLGWNDPSLSCLDEDAKDIIRHKVANSDFYTMEKGRFIRDISSILPDFKRFFFVEGGTLAVENALKVAFDWKAQKINCPQNVTPNLDVIHLQHAFHGRGGYSLSLTNTTPEKTRWFPTFPWTRIPSPAINIYREEENLKRIEDIALNMAWEAMTKKNAAAFIMEPIQGEGGDNQFSKRFLTSVREMCDETETLLIFDEVQTGVGLTGKWWAYQHYGIVPDIITFSKKTQVGGIATTDRIDDIANVFKVSSRINSTWGGNVIDMARFSAIKKAIEENNLLENVTKVGEKLREDLKQLPEIQNVRGLGLMIAFDLASSERRNQVLENMEKNMFALKCGPRSIRLRPHLTFNEADAKIACEFIEKALTCNPTSA